MFARSRFLILGCGYTGKVVARSLTQEGAEVICTNRNSSAVPGVCCLALDSRDRSSVLALHAQVGEDVRVLYSIPGDEPSEEFMDAIRSLRPARMVYLSTTGVYGDVEQVNELTKPEAHDESGMRRLRTEQMLADGPWPTLVLRPAAIYGAERGVHIAVRDGDYARSALWNRIVSRIHVDDLAEQAKGGLQSDYTGNFPVADEQPCQSLEVAEFAAELLGKKLPPLTLNANGSGRRVDGAAIRTVLKLRLRFPTYREGVKEALLSVK